MFPLLSRATTYMTTPGEGMGIIIQDGQSILTINGQVITLNFLFGHKQSFTLPLNILRDCINDYLENTDLKAASTSSKIYLGT